MSQHRPLVEVGLGLGLVGLGLVGLGIVGLGLVGLGLGWLGLWWLELGGLGLEIGTPKKTSKVGPNVGNTLLRVSRVRVKRARVMRARLRGLG